MVELILTEELLVAVTAVCVNVIGMTQYRIPVRGRSGGIKEAIVLETGNQSEPHLAIFERLGVDLLFA